MAAFIGVGVSAAPVGRRHSVLNRRVAAVRPAFAARPAGRRPAAAGAPTCTAGGVPSESSPPPRLLLLLFFLRQGKHQRWPWQRH